MLQRSKQYKEDRNKYKTARVCVAWVGEEQPPEDFVELLYVKSVDVFWLSSPQEVEQFA